jgi:flagellar basal-body rod protein FlgC
MKINNLFSILKISSAGLEAYKTQLSITAENIANVTTTRTNEGKPYKRKFLLKKAIHDRPIFSKFLNRAETRLRTSNPNHINSSSYQRKTGASTGFVDIETNVLEKEEFKKVYEPSHPDADSEGFVQYPDINVVLEMLDLITASRAYEANVTVMNTAKSLARRSLEI